LRKRVIIERHKKHEPVDYRTLSRGIIKKQPHKVKLPFQGEVKELEK